MDESGPNTQFDEFISTVQLDELCSTASHHRGGVPCSLGRHTIGGFNVVYELDFSDNITWMARIPLPYNCFQAEDISASYAATLTYLKRHSKIPVPAVFGCCLHSNPENKVNATYILMEKVPGHPLPVLERRSLDPDPKELTSARKVHEQLADIILQLAALRFDRIGSLREDADGNFSVTSYVDPTATAYPEHRAAVYETLSQHHKGPYASISDWYSAMSELNRESALQDPDDDEKDTTIAEYELLAELSGSIVVDRFKSGPFVINHNDLTVQNILVDDEFNITGILDFPGTVVPLTSLCAFPWLFSDNFSGLVTDRDAYLDVFLKKECLYPQSALGPVEVRKELMQSAQTRQSFEIGLMGPYTSLVLPELFEDINHRAFDPDAEYQRVADTRPWFKERLAVDGGYSWQKS